jgi:hypothetical protein
MHIFEINVAPMLHPCYTHVTPKKNLWPQLNLNSKLTKL